jgi:hypothetical protein
MKQKKVHSLCEAVLNHLYAATENYRTDDSRKMMSQFINGQKNLKNYTSTSNGASIRL